MPHVCRVEKSLYPRMPPPHLAVIASIILSHLTQDAQGTLYARNPDIDLKTPDLAAKYGYPLEVHRVITKDDYILEIHRIPHGREESRQQGRFGRVPILLQHGLSGSSADWVVTGLGSALAYILADEGYDVWLGNNRGNIYSRQNRFLSPQNRTFWDFSYHELGVYDLPATIDHVLKVTKRERLLYVGHSQGMTQFLVMTSMRPEYNTKIALATGLAPAAFTGNLRGPITQLARLTYFGGVGHATAHFYFRPQPPHSCPSDVLCSLADLHLPDINIHLGKHWVGERFGWPEMGSRSTWRSFIASLFCHKGTPTQFLCSNTLLFVAGFSSDELDFANLTVIVGHVPAGASWKQLVHFGQGYMNPGTFRAFDYVDREKNLRLYDSMIPPDYALDRITAPIALFGSDNDWLAAPEDVGLLSSKLQNVVLDYKVPVSGFNHYDFLWGRSAKQLIFEPLLRLLEDYR